MPTRRWRAEEKNKRVLFDEELVDGKECSTKLVTKSGGLNVNETPRDF